MSINAADAARAYAGAWKETSSGEAKSSASTPNENKEAGFGAELQKVLTDAVESGKAGEKKAAEVLAGQADIIDVVTAISAAEVTLETVVAVRDRVIGAYQEIMRMPI